MEKGENAIHRSIHCGTFCSAHGRVISLVYFTPNHLVFLYLWILLGNVRNIIIWVTLRVTLNLRSVVRLLSWHVASCGHFLFRRLFIGFMIHDDDYNDDWCIMYVELHSYNLFFINVTIVVLIKNKLSLGSRFTGSYIQRSVYIFIENIIPRKCSTSCRDVAITNDKCLSTETGPHHVGASIVLV